MSSPSGRFSLRFPDHLPLIGGLAGAALLAGYGVTQTAAEMSFGRPSSTAALGFVVAPIVGVIAGIGLFAVSSILLWLLRRVGVKPASTPLPSWLLLVVLLGVGAALVGFFVQARAGVLAREVERRPRVILASPLLAPLAHAPQSLEARTEATVQYDLTAPGEPAEPLTWNGRKITLDAVQERVLVKDEAGATLASTDLHAFDYILNIRALPVCAQADGNRLLAVLVMLRATSDRSMLLVYDARGALVYQDHLERRGVNSTLFGGQQNGASVVAVNTGATTQAWTCVTDAR